MYRILVADDEPLEVRSLIYILSSRMSGIFESIESAYTGSEALEKCRISRPDIVLMDINMPGLNGLDAIKEIKKINAGTEFIITTAYDYFEYAADAIRLEVRDYLLKPVRAATLISCVNKSIQKIDMIRNSDIRKKELEQRYNEAAKELSGIRKMISGLTPDNRTEKNDDCSIIINKAMQYMEKYYSKDITLDDISRYVNLSSSYFSHMYKAQTGTSFIDSLINLRIMKAKEFIMTSEMSIKEISVSVGYYDQNYFSKLFRKMTGFSPSEYKTTLRNMTAGEV
ncbi:MAG: response regulator [Oscillospiraceae bacterium]|nr:response regulator [Oscillospiraceae bacterium]